MKFETKFSIGDQVYYVYQSVASKTMPCELCEGSRNIVCKDKYYQCPECFGRGYRQGPPLTHWVVRGPTAVGQVRVLQEGLWREEEKYMLEETGVGSGTVHNVEHLFASREDAQDWVNRHAPEPARGSYDMIGPGEDL